MSKKIFFLLLLTFSILHITSSIAYGTVRYVSKTGNSTPPYTSWETAADSIQKAINISQFGDTIFVANGIYYERVIMIHGLSLIGESTDDCIINLQYTGIPAVQVLDSCILEKFTILVQNTLNTWGIEALGSGGLITTNKIMNASLGIYVNNSDVTINNNKIENIKTRGIWLFNSNSVIRQNHIYLDPNSQANSPTGIFIEASNNNYSPLIDSNYIETIREGIRKSFGTRPQITNNEIVMMPAQSGIFLSYSDSAKVYNNLIISKGGGDGVENSGVQYLELDNNYISNKGTGIAHSGPFDIIKNNVVTNSNVGITAWSSPPVLQYNNVWNTAIPYSGIIPDSTNLSVDPMIVNDDSTQGELDFHLQKYSPLIDAGDPTMIDKDSSRIDIGLYGGLYGEVYTYLDLAPRPPRNVIAVLDTAMITVKWNRNTESDFSAYKLFRDTVSDFTADSTTLLLSLTDTSYSHLTPPDVEAYYYKLIAVDNQGNESNVSEEKVVKLTSIDEYPTIVSDYRLYQNYPNPFNPSTTIGYRLKESGYVKLYVYDIKGEQIAVLVNQYQAGGYYEVEFNMEVGSRQLAVGNQLASGVYIYQLMVKSESNIPVFSDIKKMLMLK